MLESNRCRPDDRSCSNKCSTKVKFSCHYLLGRDPVGDEASRRPDAGGPLRQVKLRGLENVDWLFVFSCAAHTLIRLSRLMAQPPGRLMDRCA